MRVGGDVWVLRIREGAGCVVHGSHHIACEGQRGVVPGSAIGEGGPVVVPFGSVYGLGGEEVRECALPSSG